MIGAALALLLLGVLLLFIIPWVGIAVGLVGVILAAFVVFGFITKA